MSRFAYLLRVNSIDKVGILLAFLGGNDPIKPEAPWYALLSGTPILRLDQGYLNDHLPSEGARP